MSSSMETILSQGIETLIKATISQAYAEMVARKITITSFVSETSGKQIKVVISGKYPPMEYKELVKVLYRTLGLLLPFPSGDYQGLDGKTYRRTHVAADENARVWQIKFNLFLPG